MKNIILTVILITLVSCNLIESFTTNESITTPDWTDETHSNLVAPNYETVFNQNEVMVINITIESENWTIMQDDLDENLGQSTNMGGPGPRNMETPNELDSDYDPVWVPSTINVDGMDWYQVGIRFKGNSSLKTAYQQGNKKLSFKLDFDEFEDNYEVIENQRFYGFRQLNLNNNYNDTSLLREKVTADLFREFGLVSAQTRFCAVYVDYGEGSQYFGLYTLVEEIDDTAIETQLGDDSGNLYKPDGDAAAFSEGSYDEEEMNKKNNEEVADYNDVLSLYEVLHDSNRESDLDSWKTTLESVLDVDGFLRWLAANSVIQNWDTYGNMTHNYYLYNNHDTGLLTWIPWDNNEALQDGKMITYDLDYSEIDDSWPLIYYLLEIDEYKTLYQSYLTNFINSVFITDEIQDLYESYSDLIREYVYAEESEYSYLTRDSDFDNAIDELKDHVLDRNSTVVTYIGG